MDLRQWLVDDLDATTGRLRGQVLALVPEARRGEHPGGGNSILWACYHCARHADLALAVLSGRDLLLADAERRGGGGLEEDEQPWSAELAPGPVEDYLIQVLAAAREYLARAGGRDLEAVPDTEAALARAGVGTDAFGWLYRMWTGQPAAFLVRWPLLGHVGNHVGEMIATRNRMGLSPF